MCSGHMPLRRMLTSFSSRATPQRPKACKAFLASSSAKQMAIDRFPRRRDQSKLCRHRTIVPFCGRSTGRNDSIPSINKAVSNHVTVLGRAATREPRTWTSRAGSFHFRPSMGRRPIRWSHRPANVATVRLDLESDRRRRIELPKHPGVANRGGLE